MSDGQDILSNLRNIWTFGYIWCKPLSRCSFINMPHMGHSQPFNENAGSAEWCRAAFPSRASVMLRCIGSFRAVLQEPFGVVECLFRHVSDSRNKCGKTYPFVLLWISTFFLEPFKSTSATSASETLSKVLQKFVVRFSQEHQKKCLSAEVRTKDHSGLQGCGATDGVHLSILVMRVT